MFTLEIRRLGVRGKKGFVQYSVQPVRLLDATNEGGNLPGHLSHQLGYSWSLILNVTLEMYGME
jgi:hypothetical protein